MSVYAIDFDGTLCTEEYPLVGKPIWKIINYVKRLKADGHKLILWTCREGENLQEAIDWCSERGLIFDAHNENLPDRIKAYGTNPRKIGADYYIDDRSIDVFSKLFLIKPELSKEERNG